jgi:hypothetical protein
MAGHPEDVALQPAPAGLLAGAVPVRDVWLESAIGENWIAAVRVVVDRGRVVPAELRVYPVDRRRTRVRGAERESGEWEGRWMGVDAPVPPGGLRAATLSAVRLPGILAGLDAILSSTDPKFPASFVASLQAHTGVAPKRRPSGQRGRKGPDDALLARVALAYVQSCRQRNPAAFVAKKFGRPIRTVQGWIGRARAEGWLTAANAPGVRGGALTPDARKLLAR